MKNHQQPHGNMANANIPAHAGAMPHTGDFPAAAVDVPAYTDEQIASLLYMIEEEKLAGDLYEAFYDQTGLLVFDRIASAEDRHMDAAIEQAVLAGLDIDGILALPAGEYINPELQALYVDLLAAGSISADAALAVGQQVEQADIADLNEALVTVVGTPLETLYSNLETGSTHHLAAFDFWLGA